LVCQFAVTLAPKDDPRQLRQPAYSVVLIEPDSIAIHAREFLDESPRFDLADPADRNARDPSELSAL
jgi:hypothetical protein